jgi:hypothetical protein
MRRVERGEKCQIDNSHTWPIVDGSKQAASLITRPRVLLARQIRTSIEAGGGVTCHKEIL